ARGGRDLLIDDNTDQRAEARRHDAWTRSAGDLDGARDMLVAPTQGVEALPHAFFSVDHERFSERVSRVRRRLFRGDRADLRPRTRLQPAPARALRFSQIAPPSSR